MIPPDAHGEHGRAWDLFQPGRLNRRTPDHDAALAGWLLNGDTGGPFHWWLINLCHLRPLPGVRPALKSYPEAEFEFSIFTIDPERSTLDPDHLPKGGFHLLEPPDVVRQFDGISDDDAIRVCSAAVGAIIRGDLSPDAGLLELTDPGIKRIHRAAWAVAIDGTVAHFKSGAHRPQ